MLLYCVGHLTTALLIDAIDDCRSLKSADFCINREIDRAALACGGGYDGPSVHTFWKDTFIR